MLDHPQSQEAALIWLSEVNEKISLQIIHFVFFFPKLEKKNIFSNAFTFNSKKQFWSGSIFNYFFCVYDNSSLLQNASCKMLCSL